MSPQLDLYGTLENKAMTRAGLVATISRHRCSSTVPIELPSDSIEHLKDLRGGYITSSRWMSSTGRGRGQDQVQHIGGASTRSVSVALFSRADRGDCGATSALLVRSPISRSAIFMYTFSSCRMAPTLKCLRTRDSLYDGMSGHQTHLRAQ